MVLPTLFQMIVNFVSSLQSKELSVLVQRPLKNLEKSWKCILDWKDELDLWLRIGWSITATVGSKDLLLEVVMMIEPLNRWTKE